MSNYSHSAFNKDPNSSWLKVYNFIDEGSKVLDIGCSSGNFGEVLIKDKKCIVDGVELDDEDFKAAKSKLRNVYNLNVESDNLDFIKDKYDYLYFGDVIEHLVTPSNSLARVKKLLNPSGKIIFSVPNMAHLSVRLMLLKGNFIRGETGLLDKTHLHFYTYTELQRVFNDAGYEIIEMNPVLKDMPKELVTSQLAEIGLKNTKQAMDFFKSSDASIYQYVGISQPAKSRPKKHQLDFSSPVDLFQDYLNNTIKHYESVVAHNEAEKELLGAKVIELEKQIAEYQKTLSYRVKNKVNKMRNSHAHDES